MTYGTPEKGTHSWALHEEKRGPFIQKALELGITFFDTANSYSGGASEEVLGRALRDFARREEEVVATKVYFPMRRHDPNGRGLSRKTILTEIDASLRRLGMDHVDLYQIHRRNAGSAARRGQGRQGPLRGSFLNVCLAVLPDAVPGRPARLDAFREHATALQPDVPNAGLTPAADRRRGRSFCGRSVVWPAAPVGPRVARKRAAGAGFSRGIYSASGKVRFDVLARCRE